MARKPKKQLAQSQLDSLCDWIGHTNVFKKEPRLIWRPGAQDGEAGREHDGEHVYQLSDVAWYIRDTFLPHLNRELVLLYCLVHDKPEVYAGDASAFPDPTGKHATQSRAGKEERELLARERLKREWGKKHPDFIDHLERYHFREDEESRFVYALDKLLAVLNIYQDGGRTHQVLRVTLRDEIGYKRDKIAAHPFVLSLYDAYVAKVEYQRDLFWDATTGEVQEELFLMPSMDSAA